MPSIPAKWRKWYYGVGIALVPLTQAFGWLNDNQAVAITGVIYAVFMGGLAVANVADPDGSEVEEA